MSTFQPVSLRKLAMWRRRATTLNLKAQDLLSAMIDELGVDNDGTNYADSVVEESENLADMLDRWHTCLRQRQSPNPSSGSK